MTFLVPKKRERASVRPADLFENFFDLNSFFDEGGYQRNYLAPVDVTSDDESVHVKVELPGLNKNDINIEYHDGVVSISGEKKSSHTESSKGYNVREISYGQFNRRIQVGDINFDKSKAEYVDGVLQLELPRADESKARRLSIK